MSSIVKHYHHHYHFSYNTSLRKHFTAVLVVLIILVTLSFFVFRFLTPHQTIIKLDQLSAVNLFSATLATFYRLAIAYVFALILSVPLALLITSTPKAEKILLPFFDVLQSIPVLAFFPLIVLVFIKVNFFEGAAIFVLFISMLWSLVFSMIGGLKAIPQDVESAAKIFKATGFKKLWHVTLPAIFPAITTGSLLSWGAGWNVIIVAEVLHTYIPGGNTSQDLPGLGSLLVNASYVGKNSVFLVSLIIMIMLIALMNFFIWQKLLHYSERFKFD